MLVFLALRRSYRLNRDDLTMTWLKHPPFFALLTGTSVLLNGCAGNPAAREVDENRVTPITKGPAPLERVVPREVTSFAQEDGVKSQDENITPSAEVQTNVPPTRPETKPQVQKKTPKTAPRRAPTRRYVNATTLNVRSSAGASASIQDQLPRNAVVSVTSERTGTDGQKWSHIAYNDKNRDRSGWVATNYLSNSRSTAPRIASSTQPRTSSGPTLKKTAFFKPKGEYFEQFERLNYTPVPKPSYPGNPKIDAKAVFVSLSVLSSSRFDEILRLIETTELNALVIDFKDDVGWLITKSPTAAKQVPQANAKAKYQDISDLIKRLKAKNIYLIARIVTFKDPMFVKAHPETAIIDRSTGRAYKSPDQLAWSSPYSAKFRSYNIGLAKEAARAGFNEIQFDYVRFPDVPRKANLNYRNSSGAIKAEAIQSFLLEARAALKPYNVYIAADVFGWITTTVDDLRIGQYWEAISNAVDYICPMMYPSHYGKGNYGLDNPNAKPYETVKAGLTDATLRDKALNPPAQIRPWLQGFDYAGIRYGASNVRAQIRAANEFGINSYLIWHASGKYAPAAYR